MTAPEILPCPCGCVDDNSPLIHMHTWTFSSTPAFQVQASCGTSGPIDDTRAGAIAAWNRVAQLALDNHKEGK